MRTKPMSHFGKGAAALRICLLGLTCQFAVSGSVAARSTNSVTGQTPLMDRQKEIALALSACPPAVAGKAAVYVLEKSGYVKVRESENGFTAIVGHALPISQEPQCIDAEGTRTHLPRILKIAELRAQGKSAEEIRHFVQEGFAKGIFLPPTRPGVDYMLSTENLPSDNGIAGKSAAPFPPHVMIYVPYRTNADFGLDGNTRGFAFVAAEGSPHALLIVPIAEHAGVNHAAGGNSSGGSR